MKDCWKGNEDYCNDGSKDVCLKPIFCSRGMKIEFCGQGCSSFVPSTCYLVYQSCQSIFGKNMSTTFLAGHGKFTGL